MTLKLVVFVAALLALTHSVLPLPTGLKDRLMQKPFATCNPHLILPNGARMEVDVVSHYDKVDRMCLGGLVMSIFKFQKGAGLFEQAEDTAICHGFVKLLSLIDAYHWTEEMCEGKVIEDERRPFCERYDDRQKNIEGLVERYKAIGYDDLTTIIETLSAFKEEGKCEDFCGGRMNSALCGGFVDASRFFLSKMESETPEKIEELADSTESESLYIRTNSDKPGPDKQNVPSVPDAQLLARPGSKSPDELNLKKMIKETLKEMLEKAKSSPPPVVPPSDGQSSEDEADNSDVPTPSEGTVASSDAPTSEAPTEPSSELVPDGEGDGQQQDGDPTDDTDTNEPIRTDQQENTDIVGGGLATVLAELGITRHDIEDILGPEFQEDLDRMSYEEIIESLDEKMPKLDDLDDLLSSEEMDLEDELSEETAFEGLGGSNVFDNTPVVDTLDKELTPDEEPPANDGANVVDQLTWLSTVEVGPKLVKDVEEEVDKVVSGRSYGSWHFFTIIVVLAVVVIGGYLCVHNRKKLRESMGSYMSDTKRRRKRTREYKPLIGGQT